MSTFAVTLEKNVLQMMIVTSKFLLLFPAKFLKGPNSFTLENITIFKFYQVMLIRVEVG